MDHLNEKCRFLFLFGMARLKSEILNRLRFGAESDPNHIGIPKILNRRWCSADSAPNRNGNPNYTVVYRKKACFSDIKRIQIISKLQRATQRYRRTNSTFYFGNSYYLTSTSSICFFTHCLGLLAFQQVDAMRACTMSHSPRRKLMLGGEKFGNFSHSQIFGITSTCLFVLTIQMCQNWCYCWRGDKV